MNGDKTTVKLDKFTARKYQKPIFDAIENKGYKRVLVIAARRSGKDVTAFNIMIRAAVRKIGVYYYIFPTYSQAKKVIWDSITNDGEKFLDYIPSELIRSKNSQEMKITLINHSIIQLVGSDNIDSLVGTNPRGVVFSEYALQSPLAYQFLRPILLANDGWALFITTPRGKNHAWQLYNVAKESSEWWTCKLTVEDTKHISLEAIQKEIDEGLMSEPLIQQEYFCDFTLGVEGAYYTKYIDQMRLSGRITDIPWEPQYPVNTSWDLGIRDATSIIFFMNVAGTIRIIDCYENSKEGLEHYIKILKEKPYQYGIHIAPHDIRVREFGSGITRIEKARQLGINFTVAENMLIEDGIEAVRTILPKTYIDKSKCTPLIKALENYRQEYDAKRKVYKMKPLHNQFSHYADAMRMLAISLPKISDEISSDDINKAYNEARLGGHSDQSHLPNALRTDLPNYRGHR